MSIRSRIWRITKWIARISAGVIVLAALTGAIYQLVATRLNDKKYPAPGRFVDVEGVNIHLNCTGEGTPTVILESGLGGGSLDWDLVQPEVAKFTRVCSYDRAGMAWSGAGPAPRDASHIVDELHRLLAAAEIPPPYVLTGHSIGGIYVQLYASKYPNEVAGVVLVDSSHPDQFSRIRGVPAFFPYLIKALAPIGVVRIVNTAGNPLPNLSAETNAKRIALYSRTDSTYSVADEAANITRSFDELRASPMKLGDRPLIVLARGLSESDSLYTETAWRELQTDLATASSNGRLVIASGSRHYVHFYEPGLVIDSIRQVAEATIPGR